MSEYMEFSLEQVRDYFKKQKINRFYQYANSYTYTKLIRQNFKEDESLLDRELLFFDKNSSFAGRACFGAFLHNWQGNQYYRCLLVSYVTKQYDYEKRHNNFTWLSAKQIEQHLEYCKEVFGLVFNYQVTECEKHYYVYFDFCNLSFRQVKLLLFWYRMVVEFPSNLAMIDALELKKNYFPEEELYNLLLIPARYHQNVHPTHIPSSQCISIYGRFIPRDLLQQRLNSDPSYDAQVKDLFIPKSGREQKNCTLINVDKDKLFIEKELIDPNVTTIEFKSWFSDEKVKERMQKYTELYSWYKEEELKKEEI